MMRLPMRNILLAVLLTTLAAPAVGEQARGSDNLSGLVQLLGQVDDAQFQLDLLRGMSQALEGRRDVAMPQGWTAAYGKLKESKNADVRKQSRSLALVFGDKKAEQQLRELSRDRRKASAERREAIELLVQNQAKGFAGELQKMLADDQVRGAALRGLAAYDDPDTPRVIFSHFKSLSPIERQDATQTLAGRESYARALLDKVESKQVSPSDISAFTARQIAALGNREIADRLAKLWGSVQKTPAQKKAMIAKQKKKLSKEWLAKADLPAGRLAFKKHCMSCHTLYGEGGKIGPDITGGNRDNLDYILENVIAPSAVVARAYRVTLIQTIEGRLISGIIVQETKRTLAVQTVNERIVIDRDAIDDMQASTSSMMPDGLFEKIVEEEFRDLIAYLALKKQVPLPEDAAGRQAAGTED